MIPEPTDLPPRSRAAWKVLVAQIDILQKQVDLATGRSAKTIASIGVTQASPYVNPNPDSVEEVKISTQPAIPTDLALTSTGAFASQSGVPSASIIPTWNAGEEILFDPDDASAPPLLFAPTSAFEVWYRKTRTAPIVPSGDDAGVDPVNGNVLPDDPVDDSQRHTATTFTSTAIKDLEFTTQYAVKVRAISPSGMPGDFCDEVLITTIDAPADVLAVPNKPMLTTRLGTVTVKEAGLTGGGPVPPWLVDYVVERDDAGTWTALGAIAPGSDYIDTKLTVGSTQEYRLLARDSMGRLSDPSASETIVVQGVVGPDIEANAVTANNIEAGAIDGMVITGATVQTDAAANAGVKLDSAGIRSFDASGAKTFEVTRDGVVSVTGEVDTGGATYSLKLIEDSSQQYAGLTVKSVADPSPSVDGGLFFTQNTPSLSSTTLRGLPPLSGGDGGYDAYLLLERDSGTTETRATLRAFKTTIEGQDVQITSPGIQIGDPDLGTDAVRIDGGVYINGVQYNDTGWVNLNGYASGFTGGGTPGNLQYRVKDGVVYWRGGATGTLPPGTYTTVATIPSALSYLWPSAVLRSGSAHGGGKAGLWELGTTGILKFSPDNTTSAGWGAFVTSYPLG